MRKLGQKLLQMKKDIWSSWKTKVSDYLNASSIHGMQYINNGSNLIEQLIWLVAVIVSLTCAVIMICQVIEEADQKPIMVTLETVHVVDVPFPAVTIDADGNGINPLGFARKFLDMQAFYDYKVDSTYQNSKQLRNDFQSLFEKIIKTGRTML